MPVKVETAAKAATIDHRRLAGKRLSMLLAFTALVLASILAKQASGQEGDYLTLAMPAKFEATKLKRIESQVNLALSDSSLTPQSDEWKATQAYYTQYFLYLMAQPDSGAKMNEVTYDALRNLERAAQSATPAFREALHGWIRQSAETVASGKPQGKYFRPVARINAALLLANLNTRPAQNGQPPVPDVSVAGTLVTRLYRAEDAPSGVRVVALSGVRRQSVLLGPALPASVKNEYLGIGRNLLEGKPPAGLEKEKLDSGAYDYMQRYAVDIVRSLGSPEDQKWLAEKLTAIVSDKQASPVIALYAARVLPTLSEAVKQVPVTPTTVVSWGDRAATALAAEVRRLKSLDRPQPVTQQQSLAQAARGGGGGYGGMDAMMPGMEAMDMEAGAMSPDMMMPDMMMPGMEGMPGMYGPMATARPQPPEVIAARRRINANFEALLLGLAGSLDPNGSGSGLAAAAQGEDKNQIEGLLAELRTAAEEVNNPVYDDRKKFLEMLEASSKTLDQWVKSRRPAQPAQPTAPAQPDVAVN
ncbi:hypothetical protein [Candidatus Laterigemmans baculatus]|uniref:hypothetical protein n=1 Tax=Candidatus Laterigemmans baculatus TaxID=2770505 RepID=UPI0013DA8E6F|nr:hypothetical protein [Candidatus Laterigemmans baculatus]